MFVNESNSSNFYWLIRFVTIFLNMQLSLWEA